MYDTYIIYSNKYGRYYIGSAEKAEERLEKHNKKKVRSTKGFVPWELIYKESFENRAEAFKRERQLKSHKGGRAFKELLRKAKKKE